MNGYENPELSHECDLTAERDRLKVINAELLACCERALNESARVHPDFAAQLQAAIAKATA